MCSVIVGACEWFDEVDAWVWRLLLDVDALEAKRHICRSRARMASSLRRSLQALHVVVRRRRPVMAEVKERERDADG